MRQIVHITSEVAPFYKRGGLGDVLGALPKYLSTVDDRNIVISLYYKDQMKNVEDCEYKSLRMEIYGLDYACYCYFKEEDGVQYYFINLSDSDIFSQLEAPEDGDMPYKGASSFMYYLYFGKAVIETIIDNEITPKYIFCHDWQSAGIFAFPIEVQRLRSSM